MLDMPRSAMRALLAALVLPAGAGCARAAACDDASYAGRRGPYDSASCAAACPRDSAADATGRCACAEGDVPLLGACVPRPVGEAFCGPAARLEGEGASSGCAFRSCGAGQSLDVVSGACVSRASLLHGGSIACPPPAVPVVEEGAAACITPEAACPRGARPGGKGHDAGARTCDRPAPCPAGTLPDEGRCRPVVTTGGPMGKRVDVGAWTALVLGIHGGQGSAALCQPLAQQPAVFERLLEGGLERGPSAAPRTAEGGVEQVGPALEGRGGDAGIEGGGAGGAGDRVSGDGATPTVRVAVAIRFPDQDVSRLHAEVRARDGSGRPLTAAAEALVSTSVGTALEALRGLGGEASAASVELEVSCPVGEARAAASN